MIVGRKYEQGRLMDAYRSEYSELVAVTGRRRIGKTFLIRETFNYKFAFQHSGVANQNTKVQLHEFRQSLLRCGMKKCRVPADWFDAFHHLYDFLDSLPDGKKVVFIDELPWMDAPRSQFVSALEMFWNGWASARKDILMIICGSATSWIINNVYRNHGGLYNRVTYRINLKPFTLAECELYTKSRNLTMSRYEILECYMVLGGIPFYWSLLERGLSVSQNIDRLFFNADGKLRNEYNELYNSLFKNSLPYINIVSVLGTKKMGMTRDELIKESGIDSSGQLTRVLEDLENCGFIRKYSFEGVKRCKHLFQLIDNYTLFYYKFVMDSDSTNTGFWTANINTPLRNSWEGLAFERVCFEHIAQIKYALCISGVSSYLYSWERKGDETDPRGAQVDMVIDRADRVASLCEMKFSTGKYEITKDDDESLRHKSAAFMAASKPYKGAHLVLVTPLGVAEGMYMFSVQNVVTLDDLFKDL